ncbi:MAG TPA: MBL fold metallo-hydrolase, partial [Candidatus Acidoferrales bacterium]|nr:MBL fold metallo-hydrolase [Candidatus Acidoferrales bacterium]
MAEAPRQVMAVQKFVSRGGIRVYGMPVETFPGHVNNIYLIVDGDTLTLVDVGSGTDESIKGLRERFEEVRERFGEGVSLDDVRHVVITHAHIDHFGWVGHFTRETGARVWVHELDARVLSRFEERMVLASKDMGVFLERAGVTPE